MLLHCNCKNCSTELEFDSESVGQIIVCPKCGVETTLYVPHKPLGLTAAPKSSNPLRQTSPYSKRLAAIRSTSCYKTLRLVIDVTFTLSKVFVGIIAVLQVIGSFLLTDRGSGVGIPMTLLTELGTVLGASLLIGLVHAAHQAALLLVDVADCTIRLVAVDGAHAVAAVETTPGA